MSTRYAPWFAVGLLLTVSARGSEPAKPPPEAAGQLQICFAMAADFTPVYATTEIPAGNGRVGAVFRLAEGFPRAKLGVRWLAVTPGAEPRELAAYEVRLAEGSDRGWLSYSPPEPLPLGRYQVEVRANGMPWKSQDFSVVGPAKDFAISDPEDLFPLTEGSAWHYAHTLIPGRAVLPQGPNSLPGGKVQATVVSTALESGEPGVRIQRRVESVVLGEQWFRWTRDGLYITAERGPDGETAAAAPPVLVLPRRPRAAMAWSYKPDDAGGSLVFHLWGPVPIRWANGTDAGYVVLEWHVGHGPATLSVERHYVPGVGLVRQITVLSVYEELVGRAEEELGQFVIKPRAPLGAILADAVWR